MSSGGAFDEDALAGLGRGSKVWVSASGGPPGETRADAENNKMADAPRDVEAYLPATIVRIGDQTCEVKVDDKVQVTEVSRASVFPANPEMLAKARDLTSLSYLNEPSILRCVRDRYAANEVYTDAGPVLVAVNPFKDVSETLYGDAVIEKYAREASLRSTEDRTDPHVYKVVARAYRDMLANKKNQALVVSGESGAGKTETTKIALRCLAKLGGGFQTSADVGRKTLFDSVESVLLSANPALEAFGNAKTARNDNSSRFGKLVEVGFDSVGRVRGARVQTYLLEKTRVVRHAPGERAYHAFYQLVAGASKEEREAWHVADDAARYAYLNASEPSGRKSGDVSRACSRDDKENVFFPNVSPPPNTGDAKTFSRDDADAYAATKHSLRAVGATEEETRDVFRTASAILWLGNVSFEDVCVDGEDDAARVCFGDARAALKISAKLLGTRPDALEKALTTRVIAAGGESVTKRLDAAKAREARDALAKATYASLFEWLVRRVNDRFSRLSTREGGSPSESPIDSSWTTSFAVLDIYGFETFARNSFEQLCINYANERLQQRFNRALFQTEQEEYAREEIDWTRVSFEDNQKCVDVIDGKSATKPRGVLALLDEQCAFPKSTDATFARACAAALGKDDATRDAFFPSRRDPESFFTIRHYAGDVEYDVSGFLAKNKDEVPESALELLETAKEPFANALAATARGTSLDARRENENEPKKKKADVVQKRVSVGSRFKTQLAELVARLDACDSKFIRCVKPNENRAPDAFHDLAVLAQLRCCGVLEVCRIARQGYPTRWPFDAFAARFGGVSESFEGSEEKEKGDAKAACRAILERHGVRADEFQLGVSKVFLRAGSVGRMEDARARRAAAATTAQRFWRGARARRAFLDLRRAATRAQAFRRGALARLALAELARRERAATRAQAAVRGMRARVAYRAERAAVIAAQMAARRWCLRRRTARATRARLEAEEAAEEKARADAENARRLEALEAEKKAAEEASLLAATLERERIAAERAREASAAEAEAEAEARLEAAERLAASEAEARARFESEARTHRAAAAKAQADLEAFRAVAVPREAADAEIRAAVADALASRAAETDAEAAAAAVAAQNLFQDEAASLERENASLRARLAAETERAASFRDRLFEAESEWAGEMAALQAALAAVRAALESGEPPDPKVMAAIVAEETEKGKHAKRASGVPSSSGSLAPSPGTPEEAPETRDGARRRVPGDAAPVRALADELETRARVFEDDAEFIVEVREGTSEADLVPLDELKRLGLRFEAWKRDFKERMRETRAALRRADERDRDAEEDAAAIARDIASAKKALSSPRGDETFETWTEVEDARERERAPEKKRRGWGLKRALGLKR